MTSPLLRYCYRVDPAFSTPETLNAAWVRRFGGTLYEGAFHVMPADDRRGLGSLGLVNEQGEWWYEPGGGCSIVTPGDIKRDEALLGFFIQHLQCFERIAFGPVDAEAHDMVDKRPSKESRQKATERGDVA